MLFFLSFRVLEQAPERHQTFDVHLVIFLFRDIGAFPTRLKLKVYSKGQ